MQFFVPLIWHKETTSRQEVPLRYRGLLLAGAQVVFTSGPWGAFISQSIKRRDYTFYEHRFFIAKDIKIYPLTNKHILTLHLMEHGNLDCIMKGAAEQPVRLAARTSQLFYIPGSLRHEIYFPAGVKTVSVQIDFTRQFLENIAGPYPLLQQMLEHSAKFPDAGLQQPSIAMGAEESGVLEELPAALKAPGGAGLYLDSRVQDLLRWHLLKQQQPDRDKILQTAPFHFSPVQLDRVLFVKRLVDARPGRHLLVTELARESGLNKDLLKKGFKHVTGLTLEAYRKKGCMEYSRESLLRKKYTVKQIAAECGFTGSSHFISEFKKYWGVTPGELLKPASKLPFPV